MKRRLMLFVYFRLRWMVWYQRRRLVPSNKIVLHRWGWLIHHKSKECPRTHIRYTWKHRIRLWIGIDGYMGNGEYTFKRVKFRGRLHRLLNHALSVKGRQSQRTIRFHTPCPVRRGDRLRVNDHWVPILKNAILQG